MFILNINTNYILTNKHIIKLSFNKIHKIQIKDIEDMFIYSTFVPPWGIMSGFNTYNGHDELLIKLNNKEKIKIPVHFQVFKLKQQIDILLGNTPDKEIKIGFTERMLTFAPFLICILFVLLFFTFAAK